MYDGRRGTKDKERTKKNDAVGKKGYRRNLAGREVLEKVVVHDGLLDERLGPEVVLLHNVAAHNVNITGRVCYLT